MPKAAGRCCSNSHNGLRSPPKQWTTVILSAAKDLCARRAGLFAALRVIRLCTRSGLGSSCLPDLDDIAVRVTHVAANLDAVVLWLGNEFGTSPSPLLVRGPDVGDTNIQKPGNLIRVLRGTKRHVGFIVRWAAPDVRIHPPIG